MNLPNFNDVEIPKRLAAATMAAYFIKDIADLKLAGIIAALFAIGIISQTLTDIFGKKT